MKPFFDVTINGIAGIAGGLISRNVSLTFTDSAGFDNDKVKFTLNDDPPLIVPAKGTPVGVTLGYDYQPGADNRYNGLKQYCGLFYVDETSFSKPPALLEITCHANFTGNEMKKTKDRDWHDKTVGDIVDKVAEEQGLTPRIDPDILSKHIPHIDQANMSDMQFLTFLGQRFNSVMKVAEGNLYFGRKGKLKSLAGEVLEPVTVYENECTQYGGLIQQRSVFDGVRARYNDLNGAEDKVEVAGKEGVTRTLPHRYTTKEEAAEAAQSSKDDQDKETETFSFTTIGNPKIVAETMIFLIGFRPGIRTLWRADRVTHTLNSSGYTTKVECKLPDAESKDEEIEGREKDEE